ncbi:hypothetical protein D3C85_1648040 [compost metagenome]
MVGDMHQRLFGRDKRIERIDSMLQILNLPQRNALDHLFNQIEHQTEEYSPNRSHERNCRALNHHIDTSTQLIYAGIAVQLQLRQTNG